MACKISYSETAAENQFITEYTEEMRAGEKKKKTYKKGFECVRPPPGLLYPFLRFPIQQEQRPERAGPV